MYVPLCFDIRFTSGFYFCLCCVFSYKQSHHCVKQHGSIEEFVVKCFFEGTTETIQIN